MNHSFNIDIAKMLDVPCAIFIENIAFWIIKNQANKKHFHDDYYWTYNSEKAWTELFPYWTRRQIQTIVKKLEERDVIKTGNYNKSKFDQTKWYTIIDQTVANYYGIPLHQNVQSDETDNYYPMNNYVQCSDENCTISLNKNVQGVNENVHPIPYIKQTNKKQNINNSFINNNINTTEDDDCQEQNVVVLKKDIENILQTPISYSTVLKLLSQKDESIVRFYLDNWSKFKGVKVNTIGFFIDMVTKEYSLPVESKDKAQYNNKPIQSTNFEQREYPDEYFESLYENFR